MLTDELSAEQHSVDRRASSSNHILRADQIYRRHTRIAPPHHHGPPAPPPLPPAAMAKDDVDFEGLELIEMRLEIDVPKLIQVPLPATLPDTFRAPTFRTRRVHAAAHSAGAALFQR